MTLLAPSSSSSSLFLPLIPLTQKILFFSPNLKTYLFLHCSYWALSFLVFGEKDISEKLKAH
ncbi:hypothetical protein H5410_053834 [Solanum commersonii]|uniref:Uncharacterized protein n=1 Tax=Solanum commersonii TaxID=4109 RepID=A0A9J5X617_SOLCO|nr:hypothetical protein H5410_053834 [Solanum commersonii]